MASNLSMDEAYREDCACERRFRSIADELDAVGAHDHTKGTMLGAECRVLAEKLRFEADQIVRVWD